MRRGQRHLWCLALLLSAASALAQQATLQPGNLAPPSIETVGSSQNYQDFLRGYLQYVAEVTPPYPPLPGGKKLPPLPRQFRGDLEWIWSTGRGPYPSVIKGRPWKITPQATDELQNGIVSSLPPGPAWVSRLPKQQQWG
ncbi:MAG: hypothetical protein J3K34DRAFT_473908 [Monoraphidium minutum]|nr:MAG: hypothetical protein J3K34DRAFT_473908 [Monoraphidium minutum]